MSSGSIATVCQTTTLVKTDTPAASSLFKHLFEPLLHPHTSPLAPFFTSGGHANGSGLSGHIWLKQFFTWTLTRLFIRGQPVTRTLVTILTVTFRLPAFIKALSRRGGEGNYMDLCFCSPCGPFAHKRLVLTSPVQAAGTVLIPAETFSFFCNNGIAVSAEKMLKFFLV